MSEAVIDPATFRQVLGHVPTGVTVITARDGGELVGFAVGSFFSVSLDPPLIGFCAGNRSTSWPKIRRAGSFCVNVLEAGQEAVCRGFAGPGQDKFAGIRHDAAPSSGAPRIKDVLAWIDCDVEAVHASGDHDIVVGRVRDLAVAQEGRPLVFFRGGYADLAG